MNREIKFKYYFKNHAPIVAPLNQIESGRVNDILYGNSPSRVKARCQYTGLKDKNGKEIYEGDKVKGGGHVYQVNYHSKTTAFVFCVNGRKDSWLFHTQIKSELEVIGNIHEKLTHET